MGETGAAKYISEFVGTFMLVFTIGCNVLTGQSVWGGVSIACVLTVMVYSLAKSSGANFNPAVSLALGITGNLEWADVAIYSVVQIVAGICGGLAYLALFLDSFNLQPTPGHSVWQAGLAELLYTFMLCFVVLNVAAAKRFKDDGCGNQYYGLAIGFVIVAGAYSGGAVSMGCFNPAVAFGIDVSSAYKGVYYCFVYTAFELVGATLAAFAFNYVRQDQEKEQTSKDAAAATVTEGPKLASEFLGTYFLVLTVGLNVLSGSAAGAFSIAASLMCMIFALGDVSGAHFNPAVTTALLLRGDIDGTSAAKYMVVQIIGGVAAAFSYAALMNGKTFKLNPGVYRWEQVILAEMVFTFVLCYVVLTVIGSIKKESDKLNQYFGFAIGMCVTVGGVAIGKVSGGSLNPAVSIGISSSHLMSGGWGWPCVIYTLAELTAGAAAAGAMTLTHPSQKDGNKAIM